MSSGKNLDHLYQLASTFRFTDFDNLLLELEANLPAEALGDAWLMRAQIKLVTADISLLEDLGKAEQSGMKQPEFPCLNAQWGFDAPNRFCVFPRAPGAILSFLQTLEPVRERLEHWFASQGSIAVRQAQSEILYFLGETEKSLAIAEEQFQAESKNSIEEMLAQAMRFRCCLALGKVPEAEQSMLDLIGISQMHPECLEIYEAVRTWANMTTSWNGDAPRFYDDTSGQRLPILEDRLEGIRRGTARNTPLEKPFVKYAKRCYGSSYILRHSYMELFHAMYWLAEEDYEQAKSSFLSFYRISQDSGICMPLIECGEQIMPLLQYVKTSGMDCDPDWLAGMWVKARQYEASLDAYRE